MDLIVLRESRISHLESLTDAIILLVLPGSRVFYLPTVPLTGVGRIYV